MRFVPSTDGVTLALHEHGGSGRPTLFCHATGLHGAVWEPMSAALDPGLRAVGRRLPRPRRLGGAAR